MRMLSRSRSSPQRRNRAAIGSTMSPRTRSASVKARPQLGSAGHANAPLAVQPRRRRRGGEQMMGLEKAERRCAAGIGLELVVRHAETAAEEKVVPGEALFPLRAVE